tara:strand:+ start:6482 stop:9613 length:3132 start_codon:yes stop_codon:yes gene_type:complete
MKKRILLLLIVLCTAFTGFAQKEISGIVTDESGQSLPGVTVVVKNTTVGTVTDSDGTYNLVTPANATTLVFSFIGLETQEVEIGSQSKIDVQLASSYTQLDEVVAVGYGTVRRSDLTGSVSAVRSEELEQSQSTDAMQALQGRMSGVNISSESGEPGSGMNIQIRGANSIVGNSSPLFVIDGVQMDLNNDEVASTNSSQGTMNPLSMLNPSDIESIEVLKDASATAIFGSRGANGVVLVTTKGGKAGTSILEYNGSIGFSEAANTIDVLTPQQYLDYAEARGGRETFLMVDTDDDGTLDTPRDFSNIQSHNWQEEALRTAATNQHNISASGGNAKTNYSAGIGYLTQEGLVKYNDYDKYNLRVRLDHINSDKLKLGFNLNSTLSEATGAANNGGPNSYSGLTQLLVMANPWEVKSEDVDFVSDEYISPLALIEEADKTTRLMRVIGSLTAEYKILNDLTYTGILGGNYSNSKLKEFYSSETSWGRFYDGLAGIAQSETYSYNHSSQLNYIKNINDHYINALAAFEVSHYNYESFRNRIAGFADQSTGVNDISKGSSYLETSSSRWGTNRLSYLGRINYNYKSRYFLTASIRADGSDKFGAGNRWGYFPSGAFAWRVSEENFMENVPAVSNLKFRLSYGKTGNEGIPAYSYFAGMENTYYTSNNSVMFGMSPASRENPDLQWETTSQYNAGIDFGLFKNRFNINVDYYLKETRDMLLRAPVSAQSGYFDQWLNIGAIDNSGFEFMLSSVNIHAKDFKWESNFNISFNRNKVKDIGGADFIPVTIGGGWIQNAGRVIVGEPIGAMYGYTFDGIYQIDEFTWQDGSDPSIPHASRVYTIKTDLPQFVSGNASPGTLRYADISGPDGVPDGQVDEEFDRSAIGNSTPKHIGGFNNTFTYKNFDLTMFFQWSYGNDIFNASKLREHGLQPFMNITKEYFNNYWSETNPSNKYPGLGQVNWTPSSYFVEDGSYLRFKTLALGYNLPKQLLNGTGLSAVRFHATGTNLFTWTNYSGLDPEVNSNNPLLRGFERFAYPRSRTITLGVNVKF